MTEKQYDEKLYGEIESLLRQVEAWERYGRKAERRAQLLRELFRKRRELELRMFVKWGKN